MEKDCCVLTDLHRAEHIACKSSIHRCRRALLNANLWISDLDDIRTESFGPFLSGFRIASFSLKHNYLVLVCPLSFNEQRKKTDLTNLASICDKNGMLKAKTDIRRTFPFFGKIRGFTYNNLKSELDEQIPDLHYNWYNNRELDWLDINTLCSLLPDNNTATDLINALADKGFEMPNTEFHHLEARKTSEPQRLNIYTDGSCLDTSAGAGI